MKRENRMIAGRLVLLCTITYFISYITRTNYGAIVAEMVAATGHSKSLLSIALTGSFITYGAGQVVSGFFGDRVQPKVLVALGLCATILMNLAIPFCPDPWWMTAVWCVNGFAQSFMWPPIVKLMVTCLSQEQYDRDCIKVSWGGSAGTIAIYLVAPLLIWLTDWKSVFFSAALCGVAGLILWWWLCPTIPLAATQKADTAPSGKPKSQFPLFLVLVMLGIVLQGILRDGVTTWMPSFISETFTLDEEVAILTGVILPLFSILSLWLAGVLYRKVLHNPMLCAAAIFTVGALAAGMLVLFYNTHAAFAVLWTAMLAGCMHGANLILVCIVPPAVAKSGNVSTISGVFNACTYVGSALATYVFPLVTEQSDWSTTLWLWLAISLAGGLLCLVTVPAWKRSQSH